MSSQVITIKVDPTTKKEAHNAAEAIGMPLSVVIKAFLKQFIRTKSVSFSARGERPSEYLIQAIKKSREDLKTGKASPIFDNTEDAIKWLKR